MNSNQVTVGIVDYCSGNLFSVVHACEHAGMVTRVTSCQRELQAADAILLPGVGAFGEAMRVLERLDLILPLREFARSGKPLIGICLGMQLLMRESHEFGIHEGLGLVEGVVQNFSVGVDTATPIKVPHVGWSPILPLTKSAAAGGHVWNDLPLAGIPFGEHMYFVHSFHVKPDDPSVVLTETEYGGQRFCSSLRKNNIWGFQFHPEKSGRAGIRIYKNIARLIAQTAKQGPIRHAA